MSVQLGPLHRVVRALSLYGIGGGGEPLCVLAGRRWGPIAVYMGNIWIPEMQASSWVASISACTGKETSSTAQQQAGSLHSGSSARPLVTAAALCGGRSYGHCPGDCPAWRRNLLRASIPGLVFRGHWIQLLLPRSSSSKGGWQMMGTSWSLVQMSSSLCWVRSCPCHRCSPAEATVGWQLHWHSCVPIRISQCHHSGVLDVPVKWCPTCSYFSPATEKT